MLPAAVRRLIPASIRWTTRAWLSGTPVLADLYLRWNPSVRDQRVTPATDLLVDGFPRSGNGFASYALRNILGQDASISALTHATRNFQRAARYGVPAILLVRDPDAVVASVLAYEPTHSPAWGFRAYARFYERVAPVRDHVVVIDFATATHDVPEMVRRVNDRFGTTWSEQRARDLSQEEVFAQIDERAQEYVDAGLIDAGTLTARVSRPVSGRAHRDVAHDDPAWAADRARAWASYRELVQR